MSKKEMLFKYLVEHSSDGTPSVRELCEALDIKSTSTVHGLLHQLERDGLVTIDKGKRRNIAVANRAQTVQVPLLGTVTAGLPILAQQSIESYITIERPAGGSGELFALSVRGDSMQNAGILDGDIVVVRSAQTADNGDIVVALLDDEATVKRLFRNGNAVELRPENEAYEPIVTNEVSLLGRVVAVVRYYD